MTLIKLLPRCFYLFQKSIEFVFVCFDFLGFESTLKMIFQVFRPILIRIRLIYNTTVLVLTGHSLTIFFDLIKMLPILCSLRIISSHLFPISLALGWFLGCLFLLLNFNWPICLILTWNISIHINRFFHF